MRAQFIPKILVLLVMLGGIASLMFPFPARAADGGGSLVWLQGRKIVASDGVGGDNFGNSVAASATTVIVGAPQAKVNGNYGQGAAYVFTRSDGAWAEAQKLVAADGATFDNFGRAVAIDGNTIFVTASGATVNGNASQGAVYIFTLKNGSWTQTQELAAGDGAAYDELGWAIAAAGNTMIVSANNATVNGNARQGAAYVFTKANGAWAQTQKLVADDGVALDDFSRSIAMNGTTALIGAVGVAVNGNASQGAVYVFERTNGVWSQTQKLVANDGTANSNFGQSVAILGSTALVGAPKAAVNGQQFLGVAYVFTKSFAGWSQAGELTAGDEVMFDQFGWSVGLKNPTTALVGVPGASIDGRSGQGATYAFVSTNGGRDWNKPQKLVTSDGQPFDDFGWAIGSGGGVLAIGAYNADSGQGVVYFYGNANLKLAMSVPDRVNPGAQFTSETIATNDSTSMSPAVTATIGVPAAASFISASATQGGCTESSGVVTCDFGPIAGNSGAVTASLVLRAAANPGAVIQGHASLVRATPAVSASSASLVNHPPVALDGSLTAAIGTTTNGALKANDADGDPLVFSIVTKPAHGEVAIKDANKGIYTYTPDTGYAGADSFTFKVNDGYMDSNSATVIINTANHPPAAQDGNLTTDKNTPASSTLQANDPDGNALTFEIVAPPAHGSVKLDATTGAFTYTPDTDYVGTDSFDFTANDGRNNSNEAQMSISIEGSNPPPPPPPAKDGGGGGFGWPMLAMLMGLAAISLCRLRRIALSSARGNGDKEVRMHRKGVVAGAVLAVVSSLIMLSPMSWAQASTGHPEAESGYGAGLATPLPNRSLPSRVVVMAPQTALPLLKRATRVGPHAADSTLHLTFGLKLRNVPRLKQFLRDVQNPHSPGYRQFLTPAQFVAEYGPSREDVSTVIQALKQMGIEVASVSSNRLLIQTEATTETYEHALGIRISDYRLHGRSFFSTQDRPKLPLALDNIVQSVLGLNGAVQMHPLSHSEPLAPSGNEAFSSAPPPASSSYYNPKQIATAYQWPDISDVAKASGVTIAILTADSANLSANDYDSFWSAFGLPGHTVNIIPVGGQGFATNGTVESLLDIEWSGAMSPGSTLDVYVAANTQPATFTAMYNQFVTDNEAQVMTISWGAPEYCTDTDLCNPNIKTDNAIFMEAAAQGISMFAAAGDAGASDCRPPPGVCPPGPDNADFPSSSPYITAANGTELRADINGDYISEAAWKDSGGATSRVFSRPDWQTGPGVPTGDWRYSSDMAMNAGPAWPYLLYVQGQWGAVFGTSAVAPQFAGLFAIAVAENGGQSLGLSPKLIYDDVNAGNYAADFRDVTTGSNGYPAGPNWDHPTGWGSPKASNLVAHLGIQGPAGTLSGTVTDSASGLAVKGAEIVAMPGNYQRRTGADGKYSMLLPVGSYTVTVTAFGYAKGTASINIANGETATQDFALTAASTAKITGTVTDDSGHGYGLYAEIKVVAPGFGEVADVWSNPTTGAYSIELPVDYNYTLNVTPAFDGYQSAGAAVELTGAAQQDFPIKIISTCTAPGYDFVEGLGEDFNGNFPPAGWSVVAGIDPSVINWDSAADWHMGNFTGGTGDAADAGNSFLFGHPFGSYDTSLVSPPIPVTSLPPDSILRYKANYQFGTHQDALDLDISSDGGSHWTTLLHWASAADNCGKMGALPGCKVRVNLVPYLPKSGDIELRWHYYDHALGNTRAVDWYAQIDDVAVGSCQLVPGGLVFGQVTDTNNGRGIVGATVSDDLGDHVQTIANSGDADFPVGGYLFFVPAGARTLTAYDHRYQNASAQIMLPDNAVKTQDFALKAGKLSATPSNYSLHVKVNNQTSEPFSLSNAGSAPAHFRLVSVNAPPPATAQASKTPLLKLRGHFSPLFNVAGILADASDAYAHPVPHAAPWTGIPDYPTAVMDNGMARDPTTGLIYSVDGDNGAGVFFTSAFVYDPTAGNWNAIADNRIARAAPQVAFLDGRLLVVGGADPTGKSVATLEIYDPATSTWSTGASIPAASYGAGSAVVNGRLYVVGGCGPGACTSADVQVYDPARDKWSEAADYPHPVAWESCGGIDGKLYCAGGTSTNPTQFYTDGYVYDPGANRWSPIPDMPANLWGAGYAAANDELLISGGVSAANTLTNEGYAFDPDADRWARLPNANEALYRGGSACGFFRVGGTNGQTAGTSGEELPRYDQCGKPLPLTWLTASPSEGIVAAGATASGELIFDGTGQQEFTTSTGYLRLRGDTPYSDQLIPVTVTWDPQAVNLVLTGVVSTDSARKDDSISYTLTVANRRADNHGAASNVVLTYKLPAGADYEAASGDADCALNDGLVSCNFGTIALGTSKAEILEVKAADAGELASTFSVSAREPESDSDNNTLTLASEVLGTADLQLSAPASTAITAGGIGVLHLKIKNGGPDPSAGVRLVAKSSSGLVVFRSATASQGSCTVSGGSLSCDIGQVAAGTSVDVKLAVFGAYAGTGQMSARASSASNDPAGGNNSVQTGVTVKAVASPHSDGGGGGGVLGWIALAGLLVLALARVPTFRR